jgi:hypothetical protein
MARDVEKQWRAFLPEQCVYGNMNDSRIQFSRLDFGRIPTSHLKISKAIGSSAVLLYWQYTIERQKTSPNVSAANPGYHAAASAGFSHLMLGGDLTVQFSLPLGQSHPSEYRESLHKPTPSLPHR